MTKRRTTHNILAAVTQVAVSGLALFILYRYLLDQIGVELIGVWSLVTSITSITRIGDMGLSAGVVKYVAQAQGEKNTKRAAEVIQTVALTLGIAMALIVTAGYPFFVSILNYFLPQESVSDALGILPWAITSLWVKVIAGVFAGALDGCLRMDIRGLLIASSYLVYLGLAIILVPMWGLKGVVIAQLIQSTCLMLVLWFELRHEIKALPLIPYHWDLSVLKGMFNYGLNSQIISIMNIMFDPVIKLLMSKFGGLDALGYYGMANTLILQGRALIAEGSRIIVPTVASFRENDLEKNRHLFVASYRVIFYFSVLVFGLMGILSTTITRIWLGQYHVIFIQYMILLNIGWFINTLIGPAYFSNLGSGALKNNVISQGIILFGGMAFGTLLGFFFHGFGVVIGMLIGLISGSLFLLFSHIRQINIHWQKFILPRDMLGLVLSAVFMSVLSNIGKTQDSSMIQVIGIAVLGSAIFLGLAWISPVRSMLKDFVEI